MEETVKIDDLYGQGLTSTQAFDALEQMPVSAQPTLPPPKRQPKIAPAKSRAPKTWKEHRKQAVQKKIAMTLIGFGLLAILIMAASLAYVMSSDGVIHKSPLADRRSDMSLSWMGSLFEKDEFRKPVWFVLSDFSKAGEQTGILHFTADWRLQAGTLSLDENFVWVIECREKAGSKAVDVPFSTLKRSGEISVDARDPIYSGNQIVSYIAMKCGKHRLRTSGTIHTAMAESILKPDSNLTIHDRDVPDLIKITEACVETSAKETVAFADYNVIEELQSLEGLKISFVLKTDGGKEYAMKMDTSDFQESGTLVGNLSGVEISGPYKLCFEYEHPTRSFEAMSNEVTGLPLAPLPPIE